MADQQPPIAIIGLGCVLPDALGPEAFWQRVLSGRSTLRPLQGPDWEGHLDPSLMHHDRVPPQSAARIEGYRFDWRRFRIPPAEAAEINPLQLMILDAGVQALRAVKILPTHETGVILGATGLGWQRDSGLRIRLPGLLDALSHSASFRALPGATPAATLAELRSTLDQRLRPVSDDNVINASASVAAGRIAMHLDLHGLHFSVDASFASALAALETGARLLRDGTLDLVLCGGASELLTPVELCAMAQLGVISSGELRPFDVSAQGTLLGEGVALFALKRLPDALRDQETIYAVLRDVAGATFLPPGEAHADLAAARTPGFGAALRRTYQEAAVDPASVGLWECDAPGVPEHDVAEVRALRALLGDPAEPRHQAALSSAKALFGHTRAAAGAVSLLRAVLALHHRQLPAQPAFQAPHPALELLGSSLYVPTSQGPFPALQGARRAGVSASGLGGVYYHALLEAWDGGAPPAVRPRARRSSPIAITGMGGVFPGASSVPALWRRLQEGYDATREIPKERWSIEQFYDADPQRRETTYTKLGCFLEELPSGADREVDPGQLLILRAAEEALTDAGYQPGAWPSDRVAVMLAFLPYQGRKFLADLRVNFAWFAKALSQALASQGVPEARARAILAEAEERAKAHLPPFSAATLTGYAGSINAARVARRFGFSGPHFVLDSACASSHAALLAALRALQHGAADAVLCGGVWCDILPEFYIAACRFNALSATGSHPFSARADGFIPGEGGGVFVLRRLEDAERSGERVHAVLRSVAGSSDGRGRSVLAPSPKGEALAMSRALTEAELPPAAVEYVECHGTGTPLGDAVEAEACSLAFCAPEARRSAPLRIGSVKSNIGHLNAAAGVPALIKAALAVKTGLLPPSLKSQPPSEKIDFAARALEVVQGPTPWPDRPDGLPRRAGVSGFGVGGTNMHLIVEQYVPPPPAQIAPIITGAGAGAADEPLPIFTASGPDFAACAAELRGLSERLQRGEPPGAVLRANQERAAARTGVRVAIVAADGATLAARLNLLSATLAKGASPAFLHTQGVLTGPGPEGRGGVAVLFPGQGPQYANMLDGLLSRFAPLRRALAEIDASYEQLCGRPLSPSFLGLPEGAPPPEGEDSHCAVFAVNCLLFALLRSFGLQPDALLGQSAGELAALVAAGSLSLQDGLRAMRARTQAVCELTLADPGQMVSVSCGAEQARALCDGLPGRSSLAADNAPGSCIISGEGPAVAELLRRCQAAGIDATRLAVSHGYHSSIIEGAIPRYLQTLRALRFRAPRCPVVSTITGRRIDSATALPEHLASQYVEPVRLRAGVMALYEGGARLFIECGPRWPLTGYVGQILSNRPHGAQATMHPKIGELEQLHRALAFLYVHGAAGLRQTEPVELLKIFAPTEDPAMPPTPESSERKPPDNKVVDLLQSIQSLIGAFLAQQVETERAAPTPPAATTAPAAPAPAIDPALRAPGSSAGAAGTAPVPPTASPPTPAAPAPVEPFEHVRRLLLDHLMAKTGYPADMLELDLDMEADLGIDTVRQVAIIGEVRAQLGLPQDTAFKLRDHATIRKVVQYLVERLAHVGASPAAPAPARTAAPPPASAPSSGGPTPQLYHLLSSARQRLPAGSLWGVEQLRVHQLAPQGPLNLVVQGSRCQLALADGSVALEGSLLLGQAPPDSAPALTPEVAVSLERRGRPLNGVALFTAARKALHQDPADLSPQGETVVWAWSSRFDEVTGGIRLLTTPTEPQDAALCAVLCEGVFWLADFGWYTLSGALYRLASLRRLRLYRPLEPGEELLCHVRLLSAPGAGFAADALVTDPARQVVARLEGLCGAPIPAPSAEAVGGVEDGKGEGQGAAWQHFYRRMHHTLLPGEDHAW